jgi:hypothetical protein
MGNLMIFAKNVPVPERILRILLGVGMLYPGLFILRGQLTGYLLAATGLTIIVTGFWGFCPMCAMVGRKLARDQGDRQR